LIFKQDGYIRRRTSVHSSNSGAPESQDSHVGLAAAGAPLGRTGSFARSNSTTGGSAAGIAAADSPRHIGDGLDHDGYKPGMPIGLLAALGEFLFLHLSVSHSSFVELNISLYGR